MVLDPLTPRCSAAHHLLVVFKSIDFSARSRLSMLPSSVTAFSQSTSAENPRDGNTDGMPNAQPATPVHLAYLS